MFEEYDINVLRQSDCPFIRTAIHRRCTNTEDIDRMFDKLENVPSVFHEQSAISIHEDEKLNSVVESGMNDVVTRDKLNGIYKKFKGRDKREAALEHDAGLIAGAKYLRASKKKYVILTNDTVLKRYSIENPIRDEIGISIGLDALISLLVVNGGGTSMDPSDFAPLFKNIVKMSLYPSINAYRVEDLSFILGTNLEIQKLPTDRVIAIAKQVNQKMFAGNQPEEIALFLRREIEADRLSFMKNEQHNSRKTELLQQEVLTVKNENDFLKQRRYREIERGIKNKIIINRMLFIIFIISICILEYFIIKNDFSKWMSEISTLLISCVTYFFYWDKLIIRRNQIDPNRIRQQIEDEINQN